MSDDKYKLPDTPDENSRWLSFCEETAEGKRLGDMLRQEHALLEGVIESVDDGVLVVSPKGKLLYFNQRFVQIWKLPKKILESRSDEAALVWAAEQVADPEDFLARVAKVYADPFLAPMREQFRMKDGRILEHFGNAIRKEGVLHGWIWMFKEIGNCREAGQTSRETKRSRRKEHG